MHGRRAASSLLIPAHNEAAVLARCLAPLAAAVADGEIDVVVACNGCTDETAKIARSIPGMRVLEIAEASKTGALRAAEQVVRSFPRIYLDADVVLPRSSLTAVIQALDSGTALAGRPPLRYAATNSTWPVRQYYAARANTPSVMGSLWGAGVYALSRDGRARFDVFPEVIGDDLWVDQLFDRSEITIVDCEPVVVNVPRNVRDLLKILRRAQVGKHEAIPALSARPPRVGSGVVADVSSYAHTGPRQALQALTYAAFALAARGTRSTRRERGWERDSSSRIA